MPRYFLFCKPFQVMSQFSEAVGKQTLADYLKHLPKDVYPVGRLDYDSEGLLLLTNDKPLTHHLLDPRFAHPRSYWVQVEGIPGKEALLQLQEGVTISIDGKPHHTQKASVSLLGEEPDVPERNPPIRFRKNIPTSWLSLTLTEGKNRQVRRMTAAVGFPTLRLIRYSIGAVTLGDMKPGDCVEVTADIKDKLLLKK